MRLFVLVCAIVLCATVTICCAGEMPSFSAVKADMDKAVYAQMQQKGLVDSPRVNWLGKRVRESEPGLSNVYVVSGDSVWISPSDIYLGSSLVDRVTDGQITGMILCAMAVIQDGGMEARYNQVKSSVNAFTMGSKNDPNSAENTRILQGMAFKIVDFFDRDVLIKADESAWRALPGLGYSSGEYTDFLKSQNGLGMSKVAKVFSDLPDRIAALEKLGPGAEVKHPAPKSEKDEKAQQLMAAMKFTDRITETDPTPFLPALAGEPVPGYCSGEISPGVFLLFNRPGKMEKRKTGGFLKEFAKSYNIGADSGRQAVVDQYFMDSGKSGKDKATEAVVLAQNPQNLSSCFLFVRLGTDVGSAGLPAEYQKVQEKFEAKSGDWPYRQYVAVKIKLGDVPKGRSEFSYILGCFRHPGDEEGQFTSNQRSEKPILRSRPLLLVR